MSGGSMDYFSSRVEEVAGNLSLTTPLRKAFRAHLMKVAEALHEIEWVDSGDTVPGDEDAFIEACITKGAPLAAAVEEARAAVASLNAEIERAEGR